MVIKDLFKDYVFKFQKLKKEDKSAGKWKIWFKQY